MLLACWGDWPQKETLRPLFVVRYLTLLEQLMASGSQAAKAEENEDKL